MKSHTASFEECYWYTTMDVPGHGRVEGDWEIPDFAQYIGGVDIAGKSVLDVGCASGFLSFEAERRGARVTSFDADSMADMIRVPFSGDLYHEDRDRWIRQCEVGLDHIKNSYRYCHERLGSENRMVYGDIFRLDRSISEPVDISIAGAILEHLNDQVSALGSIARVTRHTIVIAFTPVIDTDELIARPLPPAPGEPAWTKPEHGFTWWMYSRGLYRRILANLGFAITAIQESSAILTASRTTIRRSVIVADRS